MKQSPRWVSLGLIAATSCAHYSQEDGQKLADEVYGLQNRLTALEKSVEDLQAIEEKQQKQLAVMTREVGVLSKSARRNDADLGVELDEMKELVARLRGRVEGFDERVTSVETKSSKVQEELELRFQGLDEQRKIEKAQSEAEKQKAIASARARERLITNPAKALPEAEKLIENDEPVEARRLVRELLLRNKSKRSFRKYQPWSQFLIGESYFSEGNFQQAAAEYNTVRKKHARSRYVPEALYKLGMCFEKLNLKEDAKLFYTTVIKKYSKYDVSKKAKDRLRKL
ncbi:MAG: tetratricopeptide repeat protein [Myxococcota bacterium]